MEAEIITIGDELLIGQVTDTNSGWMGQQLNRNGVNVRYRSAVSDRAEDISSVLDIALKRSTLVLITGGLGPTKDDITKKTLCDYFGMGWRTDQLVLADVRGFFKRFGREVTEVNLQQANVPDGCVALRNKLGTAPGMWFERDGRIIVSLPGVPHEMKGLMTDEVLPRIMQKFALPGIVHKTILTQGIGESWLAEKIAAWEDSLAAEHIRLAYLPSPGIVRLRLSIYEGKKEDAEKCIARKMEEVLPLIHDYVFGFDDDTLENVVGSLLRERKKTISTAESCTGGNIAHMITSVPGSSDYYIGSVIAYADRIKENQLDVLPETLAKDGAVSEYVVKEMAVNARKKLVTDYAIAVSGIAGPGGATEAKPLGTTWIAVSGPEGTFAKKFIFGDSRERNILRASVAGLAFLRKLILGELK